MASITSKNMEAKLYAMINCIADNYGFNADEAFEYVRWETDVDHVGEILKLVAKPTEEVKDDVSEAPTESTASGDVLEKIAACKKNISTWEKKLTDGKAKDADKQREKIAKEKAKLAKLEAKVPAPVAAPAKVEEKKPETKEKEKRIKRFSPVMTSQLKAALDGAGVEMSDKMKKEFQQYIEDLSDDDYRSAGFADHMRAFAKKNAVVPDAPPTSAPSNAAGGGPTVIDVGLDELRKIAMTAEIDVPGTYWDADNGRFVKGPDTDEDEDVVESKFDGKDYVIGEKTGRVYEVRESGDVFAGFAGVGKFKRLTIS